MTVTLATSLSPAQIQLFRHNGFLKLLNRIFVRGEAVYGGNDLKKGY